MIVVMDIEEMKEYCDKRLYKYTMLSVMRDAYKIGLLDVRSIYIWMRCREVFGNRRLKTVKTKLIVRNTRKRFKYKRIEKYTQKMKTQNIKNLSKEVDLGRVRLYDYAKMESIMEVLNKKEFFYIYCIRNIYKDEFFEILFNKRKNNVNRYKKIANYLNNNPTIDGYVYACNDNPDLIYEYKEDAIQKYMSSLKPSEISCEINGHIDKNTIEYIEYKSGLKIAKKYNNIKYVKILDVNDKCITYIYQGFWDIRSLKNANKIYFGGTGYDFCKKIRDIIRRNGSSVFFLELVDNAIITTKNKTEIECINRGIRILSSLRKELFIIKWKNVQ